jgi:hypothetical protein
MGYNRDPDGDRRSRKLENHGVPIITHDGLTNKDYLFVIIFGFIYVVYIICVLMWR